MFKHLSNDITQRLQHKGYMKEIINYATPENKEPIKVHLPKLNYQLCHFYYHGEQCNIVNTIFPLENNNRNWYNYIES